MSVFVRLEHDIAEDKELGPYESVSIAQTALRDSNGNSIVEIDGSGFWKLPDDPRGYLGVVITDYSEKEEES